MPPPSESASSPLTQRASGPKTAPHGWQRDPYGIHEDRYFTRGEPTRLVRDGGVESYDEPPNSAEPPHPRLLPQQRPEVHDSDQPPLEEPPAPRSLFRRLLRYGSVSAISTVSGLVLLGVFVGLLNFPATWANVLAIGIGTIPSFELNRRWVWAQSGQRSLLRQVVPYCLFSFLGLIVSTFAVHLAADATSHSSRLLHTGAVELANIGSYGLLWIGQFILCDRVFFRSDRTNESVDIAGMGRESAGQIAASRSEGWESALRDRFDIGFDLVDAGGVG
jgi:putative flippase GtrA